MKMRWMVAAALVGLAACSGQVDEPKDIVEPSMGGKADGLDTVNRQGALEWDEDLGGTFTEDLSFHGYTFKSLSGGVVSLEVTQRGSSRGLDTTLFLYGADHEGDWSRVAYDDDEGWGALSKIEAVELADFRELMVVVGTAAGDGRGNYNLVLSCDNDACIDTSPVDSGDCNDRVFAVYETCVEDMLDNADWGEDDPAESISIDFCVDDGGAVETLADTCDGGSSAEMCDLDAVTVEGARETCQDRLTGELPPA